VQEALRSGALGYVVKADVANHLLAAVEAEGKQFVIDTVTSNDLS
jgi:hypothetical protein